MKANARLSVVLRRDAVLAVAVLLPLSPLLLLRFAPSAIAAPLLAPAVLLSSAGAFALYGAIAPRDTRPLANTILHAWYGVAALLLALIFSLVSCHYAP